MMTFHNGEVCPQNFKVYDLLFVYENIGHFSCMIEIISEESLTFGLLTFLRLL